MQMMYDIIYKALKEVGLENKYEPQDYLNFFCLGNREAPDREEKLEVKNSTTAKTQVCFSFLFSKCYVSIYRLSFFHLFISCYVLYVRNLGSYSEE